MNNNGVLVQCLDEPTNFVTEFMYYGINAYHLNPLIMFKDIESKLLTKEQQNIRFVDNQIICSDFISDENLLSRYLEKCKKLQIQYRLLFVRSLYSKELWNGTIPKMDFIGYEYCPFPIDEQIITDLNWYKPFFKYHNKLNNYGLFDTYEDINSFVKEYLQEYSNDNIGDGEIEAYICEVFHVNAN